MANQDDDWAQTARMAELGVMTSSLLHELRQPLYTMKTIAELLLVAQAEGDRSHTRLRRLLEAAEHMDQLISHYGAMGRDDDPVALFDMNGVVAQAVRMLGHRAKELNARIMVDRHPEPLPVRARETAVRQMGVNLLQNALDAVEEVQDREVVVTTRIVDDMAHLIVADSGGGIPESLKERLFEPFVTTKPPGRGTGLGLFITRRLVRNAGGTLTIEGNGSGTRAVVALPLVDL